MALQVDNERPVALALAKGEIVDPDDGGRLERGQRGAALQPQQGRGTCRQAQRRAQARAGFATDGKGHAFELAGLASGAARIDGHGRPQAFGEDRPPTGRIVAEKAPNLHQHPHDPADAGQIGQRPLIATMDPRARVSAEWAAGRGAGHAGGQANGVLVNLHAFQPEVRHRR